MTQARIPKTVNALIEHLSSTEGCPLPQRDDIESLYWFFHPRFRFFKTVARNARLLDVGANQGGLAQWRGWNKPDRADISMYGVDLARGVHAGDYAEWESGNLDNAMPSFPGVSFEAIVCSHLIEHIQRPAELIRWMSNRMSPRGRLYLEWPNQTSLDLPSRDELAAAGWPVMISNFYDDDTHRRLPPEEDIVAALDAAGLAIVERGVIDMGELTDQLIAMGRQLSDPQMTLQGFWSLTHWSRYVIAEKV